jgi:hypothetical protein
MLKSCIRMLAVIALPTATAFAQQQPVTLRVSLREGQTARFRTDVQTWLGADTTRPATALTLYLTRTVMAVRHDTAIIRDVVDSAEASAPGVPNANAMALANAALSMRGVTTLSAIDGRARLLDYAAGTQQAASLAPPVQAVVPMAGLLRAIFALPAQAVRPGESWTETLTGGEADGSVTMAGTYTLERTMQQAGHTIAVITAAGQLGGGGPGGALAARFTGRLEYDLSDSQPARFVIDLQGNLASVDGSLPIRIRRTVTRL